MKTDSNKVKKNLEEKFKELQSDTQAPEGLKEEVFNTLDSLAFMGDLVDLFTVKFTHTESEFLDTLQSDD